MQPILTKIVSVQHNGVLMNMVDKIFVTYELQNVSRSEGAGIVK